MASASENPLLQLAEEGLRDVTQTRYALDASISRVEFNIDSRVFSSRYALAAAAVIVFYDWILTLDSEV
jgi:hypothetical protein